MEYISVKKVAEKWGVTERYVQKLCNEGRIEGVTKFGKSWMVPNTAVIKSVHTPKKETISRKSPFLDMTDIYNVIGGADECAEKLASNPEAYELFKAQIAYRRGDIDQVYANARVFMDSHEGFYSVMGASMLLALCAIWRGDIHLWNEVKHYIYTSPYKTEQEREMISLTLAIIDSSIYNHNDFPDWFVSGNFEALPADSHPAAKVYYVKFLYMSAFAIAARQTNIEGIQGLALMRMIPSTIELLVTQAVVDKTIVPEIYLRMSCAVAYHNAGNKKKAIMHIDKAVALALADGMYGILTEYVRHFGGLLEERIKLQSEEACEKVMHLYDVYRFGWARLSGQIRNKYVATNLTSKEREVAKLTAFGMTTSEIAKILNVSDSTVKKTISRIINKTGIQDKSEFAYII